MRLVRLTFKSVEKKDAKSPSVDSNHVFTFTAAGSRLKTRPSSLWDTADEPLDAAEIPDAAQVSQVLSDLKLDASPPPEAGLSCLWS